MFSGLTALTILRLRDALDSPRDRVLRTYLTNLALSSNALNALPDGVFTGLTALSRLSLGSNPTDPLPLTVTVEKVGTDQVRAKVLAGAPFAVDIPVTLMDGTLAGSVTALGVAAGAVDGTPLTVTRTAGTTAAVTVDVDLTTPPTLARGHTRATRSPRRPRACRRPSCRGRGRTPPRRGSPCRRPWWRCPNCPARFA